MTTLLNASKGGFRYFSPWLIILSFVWLIVFLNFFENPAQLFAHNWPLILVGIIGATIGNMTAIGGGIVFIPVLMFIFKVDPVSALKLAFVTQAIGMSSGASGWLQQGKVPLNLLKWTLPPLLLGTLISSFYVHLTPLLVKGFFGPISLLVGILILVTMGRSGTFDELPKKALIPLALISFIGGAVTSWVAIGEGEIVAAFCMVAYGLKSDKAIGLGVVLLAINSILLALLHSIYFGGVPWEMAIFTMLGVLWGGRLGPVVSSYLPSSSLKKFFAYVAILDGALVIFQVCRMLKIFG